MPQQARSALAVVVLALLVLVGASSRSEAAAKRRCSAGTIHVVTGTRHRCLYESASCRSRFNATYRRYLFDCVQGYLDYWWEGLLSRPLHVPAIAAGTPCPASKAQGTFGDHGGLDASTSPAFGPGPAYPTLGLDRGRAALHYILRWGYDGWDGTKALWTAPRYRGPYIVRGRQLDGPNELRFDRGPGWTNRLNAELRLEGPEAYLHPAATFLRAPGCYAYQVDGRGFSYLIVFEARSNGPR